MIIAKLGPLGPRFSLRKEFTTLAEHLLVGTYEEVQGGLESLHTVSTHVVHVSPVIEQLVVTPDRFDRKVVLIATFDAVVRLDPDVLIAQTAGSPVLSEALCARSLIITVVCNMGHLGLIQWNFLTTIITCYQSTIRSIHSLSGSSSFKIGSQLGLRITF